MISILRGAARATPRLSVLFSVVVAISLASAPAQAISVLFDFTGLNGGTDRLGNNEQFKAQDGNGNTLTLTAYGYRNIDYSGAIGPYNGVLLLRNDKGLSVAGGGDSGAGDGPGGINSTGMEGILFDLPDGWKIDSVTFSNWEATGRERAQLFTALVAPGGFTTGGSIFTGGTVSGGFVTFAVTGVLSDLVGFGAIERAIAEQSGGQQSNFRLASISISQVPLPAAAWLMLTAIGGLFFGRARSRRRLT